MMDKRAKLLSSFKIKINSKFYQVELYDNMKNAGLCDYPTGSHKKMKINISGDSLEDADTVIHECMHAVGFGFDDVYEHHKVSQAAKAAVKILNKLGLINNVRV